MLFQLRFYTLYSSVPCQLSAPPHLGGSTLSPRLKCTHVANCIAHSMLELLYEGISSPLMPVIKSYVGTTGHAVLPLQSCCVIFNIFSKSAAH